MSEVTYYVLYVVAAILVWTIFVPILFAFEKEGYLYKNMNQEDARWMLALWPLSTSVYAPYRFVKWAFAATYAGTRKIIQVGEKKAQERKTQVPNEPQTF